MVGGLTAMFSVASLIAIGAMLTRAKGPSPTISRADAASRIAHIPLYFERNVGQSDASVRYLVHSNRYSLFLTNDSAVISMVGGREPHPHRLVQSALRVRLVGANPHPPIAGLDQLAGRVNYLIGDDPAKWHRAVPTFARVRISDAYPGIDVLYYGTQDSLEYDIVAAPGADTSKIKFAIEGSADTSIDAEGNLQVATVAGVVTIHKPRVYQRAAGGSETPIDGSFALAKDGTIEAGVPRREVAIQIAEYDHSLELVIDPSISEVPYSTYLGGSAASVGPVNLEQFSGLTDNNAITVADVGLALALDSTDKAYVTGVAFSNDFPTANAFQASDNGANSPPAQNPNAFVSKFDTTQSGAASLIYSTYVGGMGDTAPGDAGDGNGDLPFGIAVDASGQAYIDGQTYSTDFPDTKTTCGSFGQTNDQGATSTNVGFIAKLNAAGSALVYSCYIDGQENATEARVALYPLGCGGTSCKAYLAGSTQSDVTTGFPATSNAFQKNLLATNGKSNATFIVVHEDGQSLDYATLYGGTGNGVNADAGLGVAVDSNGDGYITGATFSSDLPHPNGAFTSYEGGGNQTPNPFVAQFDPSKSGTPSLVYATYLGGHGAVGTIGSPVNFTLALGDLGTGIVVDGSGNIWVTGLTASTDFRNIPGTVMPVFQSTNKAESSAGPPATAVFVTEINPTLNGANQILYSTYFGGTGFPLSAEPFASGTVGFGDVATDIAVNSGKVYIAGATASGQSVNGFPLSPNACYTTNNTSGFPIVPALDISLPVTAWVAELDTTQTTSAAQLVFSTLFGGSGIADVAAGVRVDSANNIVIDGFTYSTDFPLTPNAYQFNNNASGQNATNAFLSVINPSGNTCPSPFTPPTATPTPTAAAPTPTPAPGATPTPTTASTPTPTATVTAIILPPPTATPTPAPTPGTGKLAVTPSKVAFAPTGIDLPKAVTQTLKIQNKGKGNLAVTVENLAAPFGVQNAPLNLNVTPSHPASVKVTFQPTTIGPATPQDLVIMSNDPAHLMEDIVVSGTGLSGTLSVPSSLKFPATKANTTATKPKLVIKNTGKGVLHVNVENTLTSPFVLEGGAQNNVAIQPGKSLTLTIDFMPTAKGAVPAQNLTITSDDPNHSTVNVSVSGSGK